MFNLFKFVLPHWVLGLLQCSTHNSQQNIPFTI